MWQAWKWVWKRDDFKINGYLAWMLVGVQTNHGSSSVHVQWFSCQNGGADNCDIMKWCHEDLSCDRERELYKWKHNLAWGVWLLLLLSSGCFGTSVRVFTKPQTLYLSCLRAPQVGCISWMYSVVCSYHKHASWPIWRTLSCYDFIYLTVTKVDHYLLP